MAHSNQSRVRRAIDKDEVIILTDSDDDDVSMFRAAPVKPRRSKIDVAPGGSAPRPLEASASGSIENIPNPARRPHKARTPLFLPSDEENEPPTKTMSRSGSPELMILSPQKEPEPDPLSIHVAQVISIVPDVDPAHVLTLINKFLAEYKDGVVQPVLHVLFEDSTYPKLEKHGKGKRKRLDEDEDRGTEKRKKTVDYGIVDRPFEGGRHYIDLAVDQLMLDFPLIPKAHIRKILAVHKNFYAPTHLQFLQELEAFRAGAPLPYIPKKGTAASKGKGKGKALQDDEFDRETEWLAQKLIDRNIEKDEKVAEALLEEEGGGIECGCCFSEYPFDNMVQCPDAHLFCKTCMIAYCESKLGSHETNIVCMEQSGCKMEFTLSELRRVLSSKLISLYERVRQGKEIEMAAIENLEDCPFCEWKCVIENPDEKLFRCGGCEVITCRSCKKLDHLPKSCKEMEEDKLLDGRHAIEEAMTKALMRNCPRCKKAFIKDAGCNKMICTNCSTMSCYVCRQTITGYDHFDQQPGMPAQAVGPSKSKKCSLWDAVEVRHAQEVKDAAEKAMEDYRREHPDVDQDKIQVDVPAVPPVPQPPVAAAAFNPMAPMGPIAMLGNANARLLALQAQQQHAAVQHLQLMQQQMQQAQVHQQQVAQIQARLAVVAQQRPVVRRAKRRR
ncbi:hypothetical protein C8J56DRAFT_935212 [Mycena floridula]|nr:hypothetical protein C8J56DRAFT_935212 [Mycena floridula]